MITLTVNQTNLIDDGFNNKFVYQFPGSVSFKNQFIALQKANLYYSWFNISELYRNNILTYTWTSGAVTTTYTVTIPDGMYQITDINQLIQFEMITNGTYWIAASGDYIYPMSMLVNETRYAIQINTYLIPTSLPVGDSVPSNFAGWPTTAQNTVITIPANFNTIVGYVENFTTDANVSNGYVPPVGSKYISKLANGTITYLSTTAPNVQPNSSLLLLVSGINNSLARNNQVIYSIAASGGIGSLIDENPSEFAWNRLQDGTMNELRIQLVNTDYTNVVINDPRMTFLFVISEPGERGF